MIYKSNSAIKPIEIVGHTTKLLDIHRDIKSNAWSYTNSGKWYIERVGVLLVMGFTISIGFIGLESTSSYMVPIIGCYYYNQKIDY